MDRAMLAAALAFILFFAGCSGTAADCGQVQQAKRQNCIYLNAVAGQDPFGCYSLPDMNQRAKCIRDASDPEARASLQRLSPEQRASIFAEPPAPAQKAGTAPAPAPVPAPQPAAPSTPLEDCNSLLGQGRDDCIRALAVGGKDILLCEGIAGATTRQNCITEIAKMVKSPAICPQLSKQDDVDLCNLYAKAGE